MKYLNLLLPIFLVFIFSSCSKPENPNTQHTTTSFTDTNSNYLKCTINGNNWEANATSPNVLYAVWSNNKSKIYIAAYNHIYGTDVECISLEAITVDTATSQWVPFNDFNLATYRNIYPAANDSVTFATTSLLYGQAVLNFDTVNKRVSGIFNFPTKSSIDTQVINITNGSFSMPYIVN